MSINWVMLAPGGNPPFTPLPGEQVLYTSPPRITLAITTPTHYPGIQQKQTPVAITSSGGHLYLTTRRLIYLPSQPSQTLRSFATPFLNLHDSHVTAPFFGPNVWSALLQPVREGGIPTPSTGVVEIRFTFKDGGAFDFHSKFEQLKERAQQAHELNGIRHDGQANGAPGVDLEDLPAYSEQSDRPLIPPVMPAPLVGNTLVPMLPTTEAPPEYDQSQEEARRRAAPPPQDLLS